MSSGAARRVRVASVAVVCAAMLSGCVYAEATTTEPSTPSASTGAAVPASAGPTAAPDPEHTAQDVAYVVAAVEHHELSGRLADLMLAEAHAGDTHRALADLLVATQASRVQELHDLLAVWEHDAHLPARRVDGTTALGTVEESLMLLEDQRGSAGFAPFWLLTVAEHQQDLLQLARRTAARGTSPEARAHAETFVRDHARVAARLAELGV